MSSRNITQCSWGGALCDDTKNGCVGDYILVGCLGMLFNNNNDNNNDDDDDDDDDNNNNNFS